MARIRVKRTGWTVLLIDDNVEYLASTRRVIEREGHEVLTAERGSDALDIIRKHSVDLVLVDYFMPGMTGEEFVTQLRAFNPTVQVVLQTGYASEQPPRELLRRLDIQGYHDKSEGPDKLCLWIDVGLKAAYTIQLLEKSRRGLNYILAATPELHKIQPLDDLLQGVLLQTAGLLGAVDSFVAVLSPAQPPGEAGFVALMQDSGDLCIRAATGRFEGQARVEDSVDAPKLSALRAALGSRRATTIDCGTVAPLRVGEMTLGALYLDRVALSERDADLIEIFANQAAVAIHNIALYEMAALDPLTGVYTRRFFDQALRRELATARRVGTPVSLLMIDLDDMKRVNDSGGHIAGDRALAATGKLLRHATRANDVVGRYGGDEFAVLLPNTNAAGAEVVARRIASAFSTLEVEGATSAIRVSGSLGVTTLASDETGHAKPILPPAYFDEALQTMVRAADEALYAMKRTRLRETRATATAWPRDGAGAVAAESRTTGAAT